MQYRNLELLRDKYIHLLPLEFKLNDIICKLKGTINQPSSNHYNAILLNNTNKRNNLQSDCSYRYDGMNEQPNIEQIFIDNNLNVKNLLLYKPSSI